MRPNLKTIRFEILRLRSGPQDYEQSDSPAAYDLGDDPEYRFEEPVNLSIKLRLVGTTVIMTGEISTIAQADCARCLEPIRIPVRAKVALTWMDDERLLDAAHYPELFDDNTHWYDGEIVYPADQLRETLLLEMPPVPACELEDDNFCPVRKVRVEHFVFGPSEDEQAAADAEEAPAEDENSLSAQLRKLRRDMN